MSKSLLRGGIKDRCIGRMNQAMGFSKPLKNGKFAEFSTSVGVRKANELEKKEDAATVDGFCVGKFFTTDWCLGSLRGRRVTAKVLEKDSPLASMAYQNFTTVISMQQHLGIPLVFDALEGRKYSYFVTQVAQGTLQNLVWLKHPKFDGTDERESCRDVVLDEVLSHTSFWDEQHNPQPALYGLMKDVLSAASYMSNHRLHLVNLNLENVLVYPIQNHVHARIWPLEARKKVDEGMLDILNTLGHMFFELMTGGLKFEGDLTLIEKFPHAASFMRLLVHHDDHTTFDKIIQHPLLWKDSQCLDFIASISTWIENSNSSCEWLRHKMKQLNRDVLNNGSWALSLTQDTCVKLKERGYNLHELSDLIRLLNDIRWCPEGRFRQAIADVNKEKLYPAITKNFPNLVVELYNLADGPSIPPEFSSFIKNKIEGCCKRQCC